MKTVHISPKEMAARLGLTVAALASQRRRGVGLPWIKFGREELYPVPDTSELEAAVAKARERFQQVQGALDAAMADLRVAEQRVAVLRGEVDLAGDALMIALVTLDETRPQLPVQTRPVDRQPPTV